MEGRALACVAKEHAQPLISIAVNALAPPVQTCDVILHRRLESMKVRSAHAFVGHNVPITLFRVDAAHYRIVNSGWATMTDLCRLPAYELVQLTSSGTVSCREVIGAPPTA